MLNQHICTWTSCCFFSSWIRSCSWNICLYIAHACKWLKLLQGLSQSFAARCSLWSSSREKRQAHGCERFWVAHLNAITKHPLSQRRSEKASCSKHFWKDLVFLRQNLPQMHIERDTEKKYTWEIDLSRLYDGCIDLKSCINLLDCTNFKNLQKYPCNYHKGETIHGKLPSYMDHGLPEVCVSSPLEALESADSKAAQTMAMRGLILHGLIDFHKAPTFGAPFGVFFGGAWAWETLSIPSIPRWSQYPKTLPFSPWCCLLHQEEEPRHDKPQRLALRKQFSSHSNLAGLLDFPTMTIMATLCHHSQSNFFNWSWGENVNIHPAWYGTHNGLVRRFLPKPLFRSKTCNGRPGWLCEYDVMVQWQSALKSESTKSQTWLLCPAPTICQPSKLMFAGDRM